MLLTDDQVDYQIGDTLASKDNLCKIIGVCTGFRHNDTCVDIDGNCYGGKHYFEAVIEPEYQILD